MAKRILVIDDDRQIGAIASASLSLMGKWEVLTASSGAEGVALCQSERPDAILLDMMMPDMDGPATLAALRAAASTADIPVIMLTAALGKDGRPPVFDLPVTAVIAKPFDIMNLAEQVATALGWAI